MEGFLEDYFWLGFSALWMIISAIMSRVSGWASLAKRYRTDDPSPDSLWRFRSGQMRWTTNYGLVMTIGADRRGLYLSVLFLLRIGHPPLFIPWADIEIVRHATAMASLTEFRFKKAGSVYLRVYEKLGAEIQEAAHARSPRIRME